MADHKNQHFVPKCVLKPFSLNGEGRAVNLYALGQKKLIKEAPLKNQCSRDYFYGKDGKLERILGNLESGYAAALRRVIAVEDTEDDRHAIRFFAFLQLRRTETAILAMMQAQEKMMDDVFGDQENRPPQPSRDWYLNVSLRHCIQMVEYIEDLKVRVVENRTVTDFVICDDPAMFTNRYAEQKAGGEKTGVSSSGLILSMPLTPRLAVICYDGLTYTIPSLVNGRMILRDRADVEILNELQYLKASAGVYFRQWANRDYVQEKFEGERERRPGSWMTISHMPFVDVKGGSGRFREGTLEEAKASRRSLVRLSVHHPVPSAWLSQLKFRDKIKTFFEGTGVGHVRKNEWLRSRWSGEYSGWSAN